MAFERAGKKYKTLLKEIGASGLVVDDSPKFVLFLANLGSSYPQWVTAKRSAARKTAQFLDDLIAEVIDEERLEGGNEKLALMGRKGKDNKDNKGTKEKKKNARKVNGEDGLEGVDWDLELMSGTHASFRYQNPKEVSGGCGVC